jgi:putative acetyltransferase
VKIEIERARAFDAPSIATILSDWIDATPWMRKIHTAQDHQNFGIWLIKATDVTVARIQGDVAGFIARREYEVHSLYVAGGQRNQDIGARLLEHAKSAQDHLELWTFQANDGARRFYARHGFVQAKQTDGQGNDEKLPDVHLIWQGANV